MFNGMSINGHSFLLTRSILILFFTHTHTHTYARTHKLISSTGMFISPEKSQLHWFNAASTDTDSEFHLIGMVSYVTIVDQFMV